jgi:diguanylate cyclase (GGDEF)-like protein/PAS domain S-box-containing protein
MKLPEQIYEDILDNMYEGLYVLDRERRITYWSKGAERITGFSSNEVVGCACRDNVLNHVDEQGTLLCESALCPAERSMVTRGATEHTIYLRHKEGHRVAVSTRIAPVKDAEGNIVGALELFTDNKASVETLHKMQELERMALLDPLTQLGNRRHSEMHVQSGLSELRRYGWQFGILFIDVDRFKEINDLFGHDVGDRTLKMVAATMSNSLRSSDFLGRWGGDEFLAAVLNVGKDQLLAIGNKLRALVEHSAISVGHGFERVTVSVGATPADADDTMDTLLKRADDLMYRSKASGGNLVTTDFPETDKATVQQE